MVVNTAVKQWSSIPPLVSPPQVTRAQKPKGDRTSFQGKIPSPPLPPLYVMSAEIVAVCVSVVKKNKHVGALCPWKACLTSLFCQKRKLTDKPVEAEEDYTKFNSAEFARKVSEHEAVGLKGPKHWFAPSAVALWIL